MGNTGRDMQPVIHFEQYFFVKSCLFLRGLEEKMLVLRILLIHYKNCNFLFVSIDAKISI